MLFAVGATVLTVGWLAFGFAVDQAGLPAPDWVENRYSHGPICAAHQSLEQNCAACHTSFAAFSGDGFTKANAKCQVCHMGEKTGTTHSPFQLATSTPGCGACHRDHRGVDVKLARDVSDRYCTSCHQNLQNHLQKGHQAGFDNVTAFPERHPSFDAVKKPDPGTIRFNHKYHLTPGVVAVTGGEPFRLRDILDPELKEKYRAMQPAGQTNDDSPVVLDCKSCHELILEDQSSTYGKERFRNKDGTVQPLMRAGSYVKEIKYEAHCKACHPLQVPSLASPLPHGDKLQERVKPADRATLDRMLETVLREEYGKLSKADLQGAPSVVAPPLPGMKPKPTSSELTVEELRERKVDLAKRLLLQGQSGCAECHLERDRENNLAPLKSSSTAIARMSNSKLIPDVWMRHAQFNHGKHSFMDCARCHPGARATLKDFTGELTVDSVKLRKGAEQVMMVDVQSCRECHAPGVTPATEPKVIKPAGHRCTECHLYHHGDASKANARLRKPEQWEQLLLSKLKK